MIEQERYRLHCDVERVVNCGNSIKDAFAIVIKDYLDNPPFGSYQYYRAWKSSNGIKTTPKFNCIVCGETHERKATNQIKCSKHKHIKVDYQAIVISDEPDELRIRSKVLRKERIEHNKRDRIINHIRNKYKECECCGELFESTNGRKHCSNLCATVSMYEKKKTCIVCGDEYSFVYKVSYRKTCSDKCHNERKLQSKRDGKRKYAVNHRRRARHYNKQYEPIKRNEVYSDDKYKCYLCGKQTNPKLKINHLDRPTLDHVIPLADTSDIGLKHGHHLRYNVRCCCRDCNNRKRDLIIDNYDKHFYKGG